MNIEDETSKKIEEHCQAFKEKAMIDLHGTQVNFYDFTEQFIDFCDSIYYKPEDKCLAFLGLDTEVIDEFKKVAKSLNLSVEMGFDMTSGINFYTTDYSKGE